MEKQVFINYSGADVRNPFVNYLVWYMTSNNIDFFMDNHEDRNQPLEVFLKKIEDSKIALVIFSERYTESKWCLNELDKIKNCSDKGSLVVIPIFYKLEPSTVRNLEGKFGDSLSRLVKGDQREYCKWKKVIRSITNLVGIIIHSESDHYRKVNEIVEVVKKVLNRIPSEGSQMATNSNTISELETLREEVKEMMKQFQRTDRTLEIKQNLKIGFLLLLLFCVQIASLTLLINQRMENLKDKDKDIKFNYNSTFENSSIHDHCKVKPPNIQVFINFRGAELRKSFISYLVDALQKSEINVFIDEEEQRGDDLNKLFKRIEGSGIAIVVFSSRYTQSRWCLDELVKIKERVQEGLLKVLPIFYKVTISNVKRLKGDFGDHFRDQEYMYQSDQAKIKRWKEAIEFVSHRFAMSFQETSNTLEADFVREVVKKVLGMLQDFEFPL